MISRMQEYVFMLEQAQDTIQLMQEPPIRHHHHHPTSSVHGIEHISMSLQDLGLESRRTSESSSYITEDEELGISIRKESQLAYRPQQQQHLTVPSSYITSHPRIVHKRASFPAFLPSPILAPQKDLSVPQPPPPPLYRQQDQHYPGPPRSPSPLQQKPRKLHEQTSQPGLLLLLNDWSLSSESSNISPSPPSLLK